MRVRNGREMYVWSIDNRKEGYLEDGKGLVNLCKHLWLILAYA